MSELIRRADSKVLRVADGIVVCWLLLWVAVGCWVGLSLWELAGVGDTLVRSGQTVDSAGQVLQRAGDIPLIGQWPEQLGSQVRTTAAHIIEQGRQTTIYGRRLSVLLAVTVGLTPIVPVLISYLPARVARRREAAAVGRLLRDPQRRPLLDFYLARRVADTALRRLERLPDDQWSQLAEGNPQVLADMEIARLGLRR